MSTSNRIKAEIIGGNVDFDSDDFRIVLMQNGFVFNRATHDTYTDVVAQELPAGNGYSATGALLTGVTINRDNVGHMVTVSWANATWLATGGNIGPTIGAIIYDDTVTGDPIVGYINFATPVMQTDGGTLTVSSIILRLR